MVPQPVNQMSEEFVKIPYYVEADGSKTHFLPKLRQKKGGYRIGEKGKEQVIADYWEALDQIRAMHAPKFRRTNAAGNPGLVTCNPGQVEEVSRAAIEEQLARVMDGSGEEQA